MAKKKLTIEDVLVPKDEIPYEIPENWFWVKLEYVAECLDKFRKPINATERSKREGNIPYYGATGQVGWIDDYLLDDEVVLVGEDGAPFFDMLKNKAYIIYGKSWVNNHAHILKGRFKICTNKYLMYYLNIFNYHGYVNGTTRLKLTQKRMLEIPIALPPLAEQERIVNRIESLFEKVDKASELVEEAREGFEKRRAAILEKAFSGELTKSWRKENDINDEWKKVKLSDVCDIIMGQSPKGSSYNDIGEGVPLVNGPVEFGPSHFSKTLKSKWTTQPIKMCNELDLLLCVRGSTLGRINISGFEACIGRGVAAIRAKACIEQMYINYKIHSMRNEIYNIGTGTTFPNISSQQIKDIELLVPDIREQREIVSILDRLLEFESKVEEISNITRSVDMIKKSILAKAFRGELGSNDLEEESSIELLKEILR